MRRTLIALIDAESDEAGFVAAVTERGVSGTVDGAVVGAGVGVCRTVGVGVEAETAGISCAAGVFAAGVTMAVGVLGAEVGDVAGASSVVGRDGVVGIRERTTNQTSNAATITPKGTAERGGLIR